jgi:hypothetical protein
MRALLGILRTVVLSLLAAVAMLFAALLLFGLIANPVLSQPPRKPYTGTQWALEELKEAAVAYRDETGQWPVDDERSTFLYKLMGGGERPPYLVYRPRYGICATCQVYLMTSPAHSPWAEGLERTVPKTQFYIPGTTIRWPEEHGCFVTLYGGSFSIHSPAWDEVADDPALFPWLSSDVVAYGEQGGQYRCKSGLLGYTVYTDGANLQDDGGHWDDVHAYLTPGMLMAYHTGYSAVLAAILVVALYLYYRLVVWRLWVLPISAWLAERASRP